MKYSRFLLLFILFFNSFLFAESLSKENLFSARNAKLQSSGTYRIFDGGISWETKKPFPSTLTVTENEMVQISPSGEKTVLDFSKNQIFASIARTMKSIFTNDLSYLEKNFSVAFKDNGNGTWETVLAPKDKTIAKALKEIKIAGSATEKSAKITKMLIEENSGDKIQYDLF